MRDSPSPPAEARRGAAPLPSHLPPQQKKRCARGGGGTARKALHAARLPQQCGGHLHAQDHREGHQDSGCRYALIKVVWNGIYFLLQMLSMIVIAMLNYGFIEFYPQILYWFNLNIWMLSKTDLYRRIIALSSKIFL